MICYVFSKESKIIITKINNIEYISDSEKEIKGDTTIKYGYSQDYIILEYDSINLNKDDIINTEKLEDCRDYFIKGKDYWQENKIKILQEQNNKLQSTNAEILFALMKGDLI